MGQFRSGKKNNRLDIQERSNVQRVTRASKKKGHSRAKGIVDRSSKESSNRKCRVQSRVRVGGIGRIELASCPKAVHSVKQPRTHKADETQHDDLGHWMGIQASKTSRALEDLVVGVAAAFIVHSLCLLLLGRVRHSELSVKTQKVGGDDGRSRVKEERISSCE